MHYAPYRSKFFRLRIRMMECQHDIASLSKTIDMAASTLSAKLNGKNPWKINEVYRICDELDIPYNEIHLYFPPDGDEVEEKQKPENVIRMAAPKRYHVAR